MLNISIGHLLYNYRICFFQNRNEATHLTRFLSYIHVILCFLELHIYNIKSSKTHDYSFMVNKNIFFIRILDTLLCDYTSCIHTYSNLDYYLCKKYNQQCISRKIRTSEAAKGAVSLKSNASVCDVSADRTTMKPPPPIPLAIGFTTPTHRATATDASTAWPPDRRTDAPISEQRASSAATTAPIDSTVSLFCIFLFPPSNKLELELELPPNVRMITEIQQTNWGNCKSMDALQLLNMLKLRENVI